MAAIITGSTGFVGKNLISYFKDLGINYVPWTRHELGIIALPNIGKGDSIIHLAGKAHALKKVVDPKPYYEVNFELSKKLFDAFLESDAEKFIYISSVKAVADQVDKELQESDIPNPNTHYGKSKLMAEEYILSSPLPNGKFCYILRPCMIHGPGNRGNLNLLFKIIQLGIPYPLAAFENQRSFLSVENLCFIITEMYKRKDIPSGVYNVADDDKLSTAELVKLIALGCERKIKMWKINPDLIQLLFKLGDIFKLPYNSEMLDKLTENYTVSNHKIKEALGCELPVKTRDGILKTIKFFNKK